MRRLLAALVILSGIGIPSALSSTATCSSPDWTSFGHDPQHSFGVTPSCSRLSKSNVTTLLPAWFFHAQDSITASPAVSDGTVYVGSWDGTFYALNASNGAERWRFEITSTARAAFGRIVSSAIIQTINGRRLVIFGGGSSLWALDATTGSLVATIDLDPRTEVTKAADRKAGRDPVIEVESSPTAATIGGVRRFYVGFDVHNGKGVGRTGVVGLTLQSRGGSWSFTPLWKYDVETGRTYEGRAGLTVDSGKGWGCGGVWSSPAVDAALNTVIFGSSSCDFPEQAYAAGENYEENMVAINATTGALRWRYRPADDLPTKAERLADAHRDRDFGASPNIFTIDGRAVVGEGRKSGLYVVRDLLTGKAVSQTQAGQEGYLRDSFGVGGFLGTPAVGTDKAGNPVVVGATAIPIPHSAGDLDRSTWAIRALDPKAGKVLWKYRLAGPSYGHTSIVNGVALVVDTTTSSVIALDIDTGLPLWMGPVIGPPSSTAVVDGTSVYVGTGTRETDLEWKAFNSSLEDLFASTTGASPLSPVSGVQAFRLP